MCGGTAARKTYNVDQRTHTNENNVKVELNEHKQQHEILTCGSKHRALSWLLF